MKENTKDIFGQIDALLGKRNVEILADKTVADDDFPMLTDVIEAPLESGYAGREPSVSMMQGEDRRIKERRVAQRRVSHAISERRADSSNEMVVLLELLDQRLAEHMKSQRQQFEESLRQALHDLLREIKD
jgi:hypothetical protein